MAILFPRVNSSLELWSFPILQRNYTYGTGDTGEWQRFEARGSNAAIEDLYSQLIAAGWTATVTREVVVSGSGSGDVGTNGATADFGISKIEATAGWAYPQLYGIENAENSWELNPQDNQISLPGADFPNGTVPPLSPNPPGAIITTASAITDIATDSFQYIWSDPGTLGSDGSTIPYGTATSTQILQVATPVPTGNPLLPVVYEDLEFSNKLLIFDDAENPTVGGVLQSQYVVHLPSADYQTAKAMYYAMKNGFDTFPQEATTVRHSLVTSSQWPQQAAYNNVGRIISTASMYSIEGVPVNIFFEVPATPVPGVFLVTPGDLVYGWKKIRPDVTRLNKWKWRIQQNYQFGLWPTQFFGLAI
jgi:hypothetical protein